jgi:hypothetical protein
MDFAGQGLEAHHPGRAPIARSVMRPASPTSATSSAATTEAATSAAQMSIVWL